MNQATTTEQRVNGTQTARPDSGQPRRRRSLLEEIRRVKANSAHRRIMRVTREPASAASTGNPGRNETASGELDPAAIRRSWQLRRRMARAAKVLLVAMGVFFSSALLQERAVTTAASHSAQSFLGSAAKDMWGHARDGFFSSWLKEAEPPDRFAHDIELLKTKLGKLHGYELAASSGSWTSEQCKLTYAMQFEKGRAQGFFEMTREDGRWVVDTFCFWAPNWKVL
jgi:hypothetical protein